MSAAFFIEMAWKSALIAGAALALAYGLRSRSPADRALVLRVGVAMLLLLPFIALALPSLEVVAFAAPEAPAPIPYAFAAETPLSSAALPPAGAAPEPTIWDDPTPLVLLAYLGGLAMVGSRLLAGLWTLSRWTRNARPMTCPEWQAAFERVRWMVADADAVRLLVSDEVKSPLSWGWRRPLILIDTDTLGQPEHAEAILAHEAAHVARRDWPVLILSQLAAALFWFNPLVWRLEREVVQQAEEAADIEATERVEPARYAETLLTWANVDPMVPANSIAPTTSALGRRVRAILDGRARSRPTGSAWTALAVIACLGIAAPVAAVELVEAEPLPPVPVAPLVAAVPAASAAAPAAASAGAPSVAAPTVPVAAMTVVGHPLQPVDAPEPPTAPDPVAPVSAVAPPTPPAPPAPPAPPRARVPVETLIAMRVHGVDAGYVSELAAIGPAFARLSADEMIAMRIQGVTPRFVRDMVRVGYSHLTADQLVAMRIHGVTARQARRAIEKQGRLPSVDRLVETAIHGDD